MLTLWPLVLYGLEIIIGAGIYVAIGAVMERAGAAGTARQGQLPGILAQVHPRTRTPIPAALAASGIILAMALFVPVEHLLVVANAATLAVFAVVDLALWRVKRSSREAAPGMTVPRWVPPCAAAISLGLIAVELVG